MFPKHRSAALGLFLEGGDQASALHRQNRLSPRAAERFFAIVGAEGHAYAVKGWEPGEPMGTFSAGENLYYWEANAVKVYEKNGVRV